MNCNYQYLLFLREDLKFDLSDHWNQKKQSEVKHPLVFCCLFQDDLENKDTPWMQRSFRQNLVLFLTTAQSGTLSASNTVYKKRLNSTFFLKTFQNRSHADAQQFQRHIPAYQIQNVLLRKFERMSKTRRGHNVPFSTSIQTHLSTSFLNGRCLRTH